MGDWLQSMFGPYLGLGSAFVFAVIIFPKVVTKWRNYKAKKAEAVHPARGVRRLSFDSNMLGKDDKIDAHPEHGRALLRLNPNYKTILLLSAAWIGPFIFNVSFPFENLNLRSALLILTLPLALYGLLTLVTIFNRLTFYETGFVFRRLSRRDDIDYNAIFHISRRKAILPFLKATYIFTLNDGRPISIDSSLLASGSKLIPRFIKGLEPRTIINAAHEKLTFD